MVLTGNKQNPTIMEKQFNRSMAKEISQKVQEALNEMFKTGEFEYLINGGSFTADKLTLKLDVHIKNADGSIAVSGMRNDAADRRAADAGLRVKGHLVGSKWFIKGKVITVVDYVTTRPKYPLTLKWSDGRSSKAGMLFLLGGVQLVEPTLTEFTKWFTIDPDSDAVKESDVEICDRVQAYLEASYPDEWAQKYFGIVDKFNDMGVAGLYAKRGYELLFKERNSMETAYLGLKVIYKDVKDKCKKK